MFNLARIIVPQGAIRFLREQHRRLVFSRAMHRAVRVPSGVDLQTSLATNLVYGWGNADWSARVEFTQGLFHHAWEAPGPILECGSGLSTLLLGLVAQRTGNKVWSLEHEPFWAQKVRASLIRYEINSVEVCLAPLRSYGPYVWYEPPKNRLPMDFSLVICDGPPDNTPGGRYGLLPVMRSHFRSGCVILLDDAQRAGEQAVLDRWVNEHHMAYEVIGIKEPYARLSVPFEATKQVWEADSRAGEGLAPADIDATSAPAGEA